MNTKQINNCGPDTIDAHGWQIQRGYVYRVTAADESAWDCSEEIECEGGYTHVEERRFGYNGNDVPPCGADYLCASEDGEEFLVISSESDPEVIDTVDGFTLERFDFEPGDDRHDGTWEFRVLDVKSDGETILAGKA